MAWERKEYEKDQGMSFRPYYYVMELGNLSMELNGGYESSPYCVRLYLGTVVLHKEYFRAETLEDAKKAAVSTVRKYLDGQLKLWQDTNRQFNEMTEKP